MAEVFVYKADPERGRRWAEVFRREAPEIDFRIWPDVGDPLAVHYLAAWVPPEDIGARFPNLKLLFSTGAGIDQFDLAALPRALPVVRMIEPGIVGGMVEYVTHAVLDLHRDMPAYRRAQKRREWKVLPVKTAAERRVGVLGLGSLGQAVLAQLTALHFDCAGWSRSRRTIDGVRCFAGDSELPDFLARTEILVCLLPLTAETRGFLNGELFARLPQGAARRNSSRRTSWRRSTAAASPRRCSTSPTPSRCRRSIRCGRTSACASPRTSPARRSRPPPRASCWKTCGASSAGRRWWGWSIGRGGTDRAHTIDWSAADKKA
jgi:glyoxylate/hydroxypyruvate reductase A